MIFAARILWDWVLLWGLVTFFLVGFAWVHGYDRGWQRGQDFWYYMQEDDEDPEED